jgi:hypothetical protein
MRNNIKYILSFFLLSLYELNRKRKHIVLLLLIPLSEIKSIFYESDLRVSWYLFSDNKRLMCNVLEDYSNCIIIGVVFYYSLFVDKDLKTKQMLFFLFVMNALDFVFLGLMDNNYYLLKLPLSAIIYTYGIRKVAFSGT